MTILFWIPDVLILIVQTITLKSIRNLLFKKRGPSKENRRDPIVGMGLLLDAQMLPVGMKIFLGNESENLLRDLIHDLKSRNNIKGRTIQIADKGLNCAKNIIEAIDNGDGYLFSKSVKTLPEKERQWVLLDDGLKQCLIRTENPFIKSRNASIRLPIHTRMITGMS